MGYTEGLVIFHSRGGGRRILTVAINFINPSLRLCSIPMTTLSLTIDFLWFPLLYSTSDDRPLRRNPFDPPKFSDRPPPLYFFRFRRIKNNCSLVVLQNFTPRDVSSFNDLCSITFFFRTLLVIITT